jgi:HEAT repeat protein
MSGQEELVERHSGESALLMDALQGSCSAANKVLMYLSSTNPYLRQIMEETIRDHPQVDVWQHLLHCLAQQRWNDQRDCERRADRYASHRIDLSITEVFLKDENENERAVKMRLLLETLSDTDILMRQTAACLLGQRGDARAIPVLQETIETAARVWKVRAIRSLGHINDRHAGMILARALAMDRGVLHREARQALFRLGEVAEPAYLCLLSHTDSHIRWHGARGMGELGSVHAIYQLADGLRDENPAVAWATARVLGRLGAEAVPAVLSQISHHALNEPFRLAATHALHRVHLRIDDERLKPLLSALQGPAADIEAPGIAQRLLVDWQATANHPIGGKQP